MKSLFVFAGGATVGSVASVVFIARKIIMHEPTMRFLGEAAAEKVADWLMDGLEERRPRPRTPYNTYNKPHRHIDRKAQVDAAALDFLQKRHEETAETGWNGGDCVNDVTTVLQQTGRL